MSAEHGFYADFPGARQQVFVHTSRDFDSDRARSGAVENWRRMSAVAPANEVRLHAKLAEQAAGGLEHLIGDLDPDLVERIVLAAVSQMGALVAIGAHPGIAMNVVGLAVMHRAGSIDLEQS